MLGPLSDQTFFCKALLRLKEICIVKQQTQKSRKQGILQKHPQIDQLIFASYRTHAMNFCASLRIFIRQGHRTPGNKITDRKSKVIS